LELQNLVFLEHVPHEKGGKHKGKEFLGTKGMGGKVNKSKMPISPPPPRVQTGFVFV